MLNDNVTEEEQQKMVLKGASQIVKGVRLGMAQLVLAEFVTHQKDREWTSDSSIQCHHYDRHIFGRRNSSRYIGLVILH